MIRQNDAAVSIFQMIPKLGEILEIEQKEEDDGEEKTAEEEKEENVHTAIITIEGQSDDSKFEQVLIDRTIPVIIADEADDAKMKIFWSKVDSALEPISEIKSTLVILNLLILFQLVVCLVLFLVIIIPNCVFNEYRGYRWIFVFIPLSLVIPLNFYGKIVLSRFQPVVEAVQALCEEESKLYEEKKISFRAGGYVSMGDNTFILKEEFTQGIYPLSILVTIVIPVVEEDDASVSSNAHRVEVKLKDLESIRSSMTDEAYYEARTKIIETLFTTT